MNLCQNCRTVTQHPLGGKGPGAGFEHDSNSLREAVENGCFVCSQFWESLTANQKDVATRPEFQGITCSISSNLYLGADGSKRPILATMSFFGKDDLWECDDAERVGWQRSGLTGDFSILDPTMFPANHAPKLAECTHDQSCWNTVSAWINMCKSQHGSCQVSPQHWFPTRLVDVSDLGDGCIRVVDSSNIPKNSQLRYLALSHCWGLLPFLTMDELNRAEFERGVLVASLPLNFQDAIAATRMLDCRYIWIDSLCIVQHSAGDWLHEAPLMNKVYKNAFLTLAAMSSSDAHGGLFRKRDPSKLGPCPFKVRLDGAGVVDCLLVRSDFWEVDMRCAPLNQRAWVVQERVLAPRTLYFAENQLFWECRELHACETFQDGVPVALVSEIQEPDSVDVVSVKAFEETARKLGQSTVAERRDSFDRPSGECRQYMGPYDVWSEILRMYAQCAITFPADKFVAISGVVKDFASAVGDEYVAGLWRKNFVNGMLWQVWDRQECMFRSEEYQTTPAARPPEYRAPSWSWASVDAPMTRAVSNEVDLCGEYVQVLGINIVPKDGDPTGRLRHACLRVKGHLIKTSRKPQKPHMRGHQFGKFLPDVEEELVQGDYFCMPLRTYAPSSVKKDGAPGRGTPELLGLVLRAWAADAEFGTRCTECSGVHLATRVGTFRMSKDEPLRLLGMSKPRDWEQWGTESDRVWYSEDAELYEVMIV